MTNSTKAPRPSLAEHMRLAARSADFQWLMSSLRSNHGPVVEVGFGRPPLKLTYVFGPEANRFVLADGADNFMWSEAYKLTKFLIGETALLVSDGEDHARRRRLVQPAFARRRLDSKLGIAIEEIDKTLSSWTPGRSLDAYVDLRKMVRRISVRSIFGGDIGDLADEFGTALEPALTYLGQPPARRVDVNLGFNGYARAIRARKAADRLIMEAVARRRDDGHDHVEGYDVLGALLEGRDGNDRPLSDTELCDQVRGLIAAGYDTTSSAASWLVHLLGTHPATFAQLVEQVSDTIDNRPPTIDDLRAMPLVDAVVRETLRLRPPAPVGLRIARNEVDICGVTIPAESMVVYSPFVTHHLPDLWERPTEFDPSRWAGDEPTPFSYVPFGGGARQCIGFVLASLELQALAVRLAQTTVWRVENPNPTSRNVANFAPKGGMPITISTSPPAPDSKA